MGLEIIFPRGIFRSPMGLGFIRGMMAGFFPLSLISSRRLDLTASSRYIQGSWDGSRTGLGAHGGQRWAGIYRAMTIIRLDGHWEHGNLEVGGLGLLGKGMGKEGMAWHGGCMVPLVYLWENEAE